MLTPTLAFHRGLYLSHSGGLHVWQQAPHAAWSHGLSGVARHLPHDEGFCWFLRGLFRRPGPLLGNVLPFFVIPTVTPVPIPLLPVASTKCAPVLASMRHVETRTTGVNVRRCTNLNQRNQYLFYNKNGDL